LNVFDIQAAITGFVEPLLCNRRNTMFGGQILNRTAIVTI